MQLLGTKGQKFLHCPGTKGQRDNLKILPRDGTGRDNQNSGWDGPGQPKFRTGQAGTAKIWDGTRDQMGQSRKGCSKIGK